MAIYKRYKGKRVKHGSKEYKNATWIAEGSRDGVYYKVALKDAKTREDAKTEEDNIIAQIRAGEFEFYKDKTTFREYVEVCYLPHIQTNNPSWENNKKYIVERLLNFFDIARLKSITRAKCEEYKRFRANQTIACKKCANYKETCAGCSGDSPRYQPPCWKCRKRIEEMQLHRPVCVPAKVNNSTVNRDLIVLSHIFSLALADGKIKENPMRFVPSLPENESRMRVLSIEEKARLVAAVGDNKKLLAIVTVALTTGWRKGQILSVQKADLKAEYQAVQVIKSKKSKPRLMPVSDLAWQTLTFMAEKVETGFLFRNDQTGERLKDFKESWWKALKKANINDFRFHDLRRTCASELLKLGVNEFTIRDVLGHTKIDTTAVYARVQDTDLRAGLQKLGETYNDSDFLM